MEITVTCTLAFLEMTFVFVGLLLLHGLRKLIGSAAFYIAVGLLLIFTQLVSAAGLKVVLGYPGADFYVAPTVLFLPYLTALMIVYVTEGTLATQRLIIGAMATLGLYMYISHLTAVQCNWSGYVISQGPAANSMDYLLEHSQKTMAGSILAQTLDLFLIPIFFQRLRNLKCRVFFSVLGALMLTQIVDTFVYTTACYWGEPAWWSYINSSYIAKAVATICLSVLATIYINRIEKEAPGEGRRALDIVFAFFGGYGKAQALEQHLREWEGRYRMVVENASDMILLLNSQGIILDANFAAVRIMGLHSREGLRGKAFNKMIFDDGGRPVDWNEYCSAFRVEDTKDGPHIDRLLCRAFSRNRKIDLDIAISRIDVEEVPMLICLGRDVTEQKRLAREKEELSVQLAHTQRLESIGKLAGGVAHDFNNYIHAIMGHLDVLTEIYNVDDEKILRHIKKINEISEKAGRLTQQLLGFARKGRYIKKRIELGELLRQSSELFLPDSQEDLEFKLIIPDRPMYVEADPVQLQQVMLNLLINARDAMEEAGGDRMELLIRADEAGEYDIPWKKPGGLKIDPKDYWGIQVRDSGTGIDDKIKNSIFEPFFTTKPFGKGTGMGLAMVYGTITSHKGRLYVASAPGHGTSFYIFLPKSRDASGTDTEIHADGKGQDF